MRIMMSAAASAVAPGIIRHLQKLGHQVIGLDSQPWFTDKFADQAIRCPKVGGEYVKFLRNFHYDMYLPFLDEELYLFGIAGEPENCMCSPEKTLLTFTSKVRQQRFMAEAGLDVVPEVEVVIKPDHGRGGKGITKVMKSTTQVVQRFIHGVEYTIDCLVDWNHKLLFAVPRKRLVENGVSIVGQIDMHPDMVELAADVVSKFKFCGPINVQAIREKGTGEIFITEVNARLSGSCMFTVMAGWDILNDVVRLQEEKSFITPDVSEIMVRRHFVEEIV